MDCNLEDLIFIVEKYGLQLLLKKSTITYKKVRYYSIIILVFVSRFYPYSFFSLFAQFNALIL